MLIVCPTIDYEIFLGKNLLSADEILFKPTEKILKLWKDFNIMELSFLMSALFGSIINMVLIIM